VTHDLEVLREAARDLELMTEELAALRAARDRQIVIAAEGGATEREIAKVAGVTPAYVNRVKQAARP
jgi:hypothetical protein